MKLVISADWHMRPDRPLCRRDSDWERTQREAVRFLVELSNAHAAALVVVGDLSHRPKLPPWLLNLLLSELSALTAPLYLMAGNHDLPEHAWERVMESSLGTLLSLPGGVVRSISEIGRFSHFGTGTVVESETNPWLLFLHELVFEDEAAIPYGAAGKSAHTLLTEHPEARWIFVGDNHHHFHYRSRDGRHVVSPGCLTAQSAAFVGYQPVCLLFDTEREALTVVPIPGDPALVTDDHIIEENRRNSALDAFIETVRTGGEVSLSFLENLKGALTGDAVSPAVRREVENLIEEEQERE